jgi:hypothetical protein
VNANLRRVAIGILVVGTLALLGWIVSRQLAPGGDVPDDAVRAETALAGPEQTALAFVDVALLRQLLAGAAAPEADLDALLLHPLGLRGVSLARDVSRAVVALSRDGELTLVLFGSFDAAAIEAAVRAASAVAVRDATRGDERVLDVTRVDEDTCGETPIAIALRADRVVLAHARALDTLLARLADPPPAEGGSRWRKGLRAFEGDPLVRVALADPSALAAASDAPVARALLGSVARLLEGSPNARIEARRRGLTGGLAIALEVASRDPKSAAARWEAFRAAARAEWARVVPPLAAWQDALSIDADGDAVRATAQRGADSVVELPSLPDALVVLASRDFRGPAPEVPATPETAEGDAPAQADAPPVATDPRPLRFAAEQSLDRLRPYSPDRPLAGAADVIAGPFGIRVERATRLEPEAPLELAIRAVGPALANLPEPTASPRLVIESVSDEAGTSLLREERCGPDRNGVPGHLTAGLLSDFVEGVKTVRLVPTASLDLVERIAGRVEFELPVRTATVRMPANVGAVLESEGASLELTGVAPDRFSYRVTGDVARLIHVRGLDAERRPLEAREAFELPRLAGDGRVGARAYQGGLATVEALFALETEPAAYPFALASARPGSDGEEQHVESSSFIRYSTEQYEAEFGKLSGSWPPDRRAVSTATAGPFSVGLDGFEAGKDVAARLTVIAPNVPNLTYHATALELALTGVGLVDGRVVSPSEDAVAREHARALLNARRQFGRTDVEARTRLATGVADDATGVARLDGQVVLRIPQVVDSFELAAVEPGKSVVSKGTVVSLRELGRDRLTLQLSGPLERFFSVRAFAADGHELASEETNVPSPASPGPHELRFEVHGQPARVVVQLVRDHSERRYAFRIELPVSEPAAAEE